MPGYDGMGGWGWMMFMSLGGLVFVVLTAVVVWLLIRATGTATFTGARPTAAPGDTAREILAQRYARGEIDDEEYQRRLRTLGG